ncbi:MAG: type II secretion protein F [Planctomycetota bacterium]|nr:MAG: type II secretion protein F [Planctomycetota bacterium]
MPTFQFEAMDASGQEIKDVIEAPTEAEATATIKQMGYYVTKIGVKKGKAKKAAGAAAKKKGKTFVIGGVPQKVITGFTRQLSILQDAGLPILRSLKILEGQCKPGRMKNALIDTCDEIEGGSTLSEAMNKSPKVFDRLYVNMIKAGEAGGALEVILRRLAEFQERSLALKRRVQGALIYPIFVVLFAVAILAFIMIFIVPKFEEIFREFDATLPPVTQMLMDFSRGVVEYWYAIPLVPISLWLFIKLMRKFPAGREGWDIFLLKMPIFGSLVEKNALARSTRTLGTLISSGVPILEALNITRETTGNAVFENIYQKISESIREGEPIAKPMKQYSKTSFQPFAAVFFFVFIPVVGVVIYLMRANKRVIDDLVVNMVDVGEETGELDTMLYKVADNFDEEVKVLTEGLTKLMEPLLIIFLGGAVGFIVIALFMPLVGLIEKLSSSA